MYNRIYRNMPNGVSVSHVCTKNEHNDDVKEMTSLRLKGVNNGKKKKTRNAAESHQSHRRLITAGVRCSTLEELARPLDL